MQAPVRRKLRLEAVVQGESKTRKRQRGDPAGPHHVSLYASALGAAAESDMAHAPFIGIDQKNPIDFERMLILKQLPPRCGRIQTRRQSAGFDLCDQALAAARDDVVGAQRYGKGLAIDMDRVTPFDLCGFDEEALFGQERYGLSLPGTGPLQPSAHAAAAPRPWYPRQQRQAA